MKILEVLIGCAVILSLMTSLVLAAAPPQETPALEQLLERARANYSGIRTVQGEITVSVQMTVGNVEVHNRFMYKAPDRLRVESVAPVASTYIVTGNESWMYIPEKRQAAHFKSTGTPLALNTPAKDDMSGFYTGMLSLVNLPAVLLDPKTFKFQLHKTAEDTVVVQAIRKAAESGVIYFFSLDKVNCLMTRIAADQKGANIADFRLSAYHSFKPDAQIATKLRVVLTASPTGAPVVEEIELHRLKINEDIPDSEFKLSLPEGVTITEESLNSGAFKQ